MKIVLISPKGPLYRHRGGIFKKSLRYQPLTLTTLAALVPEDLNAEIQLIDESIQVIPENLEADIVGMTVITGTAKRSYELAAQFRQQGIFVVLGGPHVTLVPEEAAEYADAICVGYAEQSWPQLLRDFKEKQPKHRYDQDSTFTLEGSPFPKRDLFNKHSFLTQAVFEATRSCAHHCDFCVAPSAWGSKQYQHPVDWVIEDIKRLGQKKIIFVDLNLISDKGYATELFTQLIPLNIQWFGLSTVLIAHDDHLLELMARSGCKGLLLGLETVSETSLKETHKHFNASVNYYDLIKKLHGLGISIQGCFVFGLDNDSIDVFDETVEFVLETGIDLPRYAVLTPFPGTPLYQRLNDEGRILTRDWELYDGQHVVFEPKQMSMEELLLGHERAWKKTYTYSNIAKRLWQAKNFQALAITSNLGYRFYANNLDKFYNCDWHIQSMMPNPLAGFGTEIKTMKR
ncbi:MAG: radical SAM protein [Sulfuricurvum sp.]|uniref:B12-binding domain-containing radical SAM protein n=1 Tax=Sulfuricurvum sp. TaxID=2025608 RepID=UPI0026316EED|nr:radical SAM protein [Sulfuricurvum sp.]MDD2830365.1 radical SAM protein [Sulfuricurvum sp.]MDD4950660.1 radical SAM protein [Sulfuricurvum sp.]